MLAKDELLNITLKDQIVKNLTPMFIACAEKVVKIFSDLKLSVYGKTITLETTQENETQNLSTDELLRTLNEN